MKTMNYNLTIIVLFLAFISACKPDSKTAQVENSTSSVASEIEILEDPEALFARANSYYNKEDYDRAIADLEKAIKSENPKAAYYHLLSDCNLDYYRSKDALMNMEKAAELFPENIPTWLKLSETQLILQQLEPALISVAQVMALEPDNPDAHFMKGMIFRAMGEGDRAINAFQTTTELDPEFTDAWLFAGELFEEKGLEIALDYYNGAINSSPDNITALHSKAFYLQNHNQDMEAIKIYKQINQIDKNYMNAYLNTGILYMTMDSLDKAMEQFNIMAGIQPQNHLPYYYRGLIYDARGDISAARTELQNCINLKSDFSKAKNALLNLSNS